ncbi:hypothetical protein PJWF_00031 [Achromobacter phage JWF]|uniref:hypothetical protein n=1 Tax=Achromobacter phage JWF TaxID=1589748 RepID=UPI000588E382|nr:hypothetical protein AXJ13_gp031 [Achromobacter phage JWF]AJD82925.1 hypothetical protein PJWF_00031 [Achromobacter phage JWF]
MNDPQAQAQPREPGDYMIQALQHQRNNAMDLLAQTQMSLGMAQQGLEQAIAQNKALNEMNEAMIKANAELEGELARLRSENQILATKLDSHAHCAQGEGVLTTLLTADNPPAHTPPPPQAQAGEPATARGSES